MNDDDFRQAFSDWCMNRTDHQALLHEFQAERHENKSKNELDVAILVLKCHLAGRSLELTSVWNNIPGTAAECEAKRFNIDDCPRKKAPYIYHINTYRQNTHATLPPNPLPIRQLDLEQTKELMAILQASPYWLEVLVGSQTTQPL